MYIQAARLQQEANLDPNVQVRLRWIQYFLFLKILYSLIYLIKQAWNIANSPPKRKFCTEKNSIKFFTWFFTCEIRIAVFFLGRVGSAVQPVWWLRQGCRLLSGCSPGWGARTFHNWIILPDPFYSEAEPTIDEDPAKIMWIRPVPQLYSTVVVIFLSSSTQGQGSKFYMKCYIFPFWEIKFFIVKNVEYRFLASKILTCICKCVFWFFKISLNKYKLKTKLCTSAYYLWLLIPCTVPVSSVTDLDGSVFIRQSGLYKLMGSKRWFWLGFGGTWPNVESAN